MKTSTALLFSGIVAAFITTDANVIHLRVNESSARQLPEAARSAAAKSPVVICLNPRDETFASGVTYARVDVVRGGFNVYYRVANNQIRYHCNCKYADKEAFANFFDTADTFETANHSKRCYSKDISADRKVLQRTHDVYTREMVLDYVCKKATLSVEKC